MEMNGQVFIHDSMALQLRNDCEFNFDAAQIKIMLRSSGISQALELHFSKLNRLVKYNVVGAVKLLIASGAISGGYQADEFDIDRTTNTNSGISTDNYIYLWSVRGTIQMQDYRPSA